MKKLLFSLIGVAFTGCIIGCVPVNPQLPMSAMQVRSVQSREFDTRDSKLVMQAVLNALQDEGFVTHNAVVDLGLITASRELQTENQFDAFLSSVLMGRDAEWERSALIEATVNVSSFGPQTRVRVSFHKKTLDNRGRSRVISDVVDPSFYQNFFSKLDKSIFIQRERV